jgi:hypothetical protein
MKRQTRSSAAISRRTLVTASAGWMLGAGGLILPAPIDEAEARDGGLGGRHGQDHRRSEESLDRPALCENDGRHFKPSGGRRVAG